MAVAAGRDVGMCRVSPSDDDPAVAGLYAMWVAPDSRGCGVGDALIASALDVARAGGGTRIVLEVGDHNAPAIALYLRWGFVPTGRTTALPPPREHVTEHERARDL